MSNFFLGFVLGLLLPTAFLLSLPVFLFKKYFPQIPLRFWTMKIVSTVSKLPYFDPDKKPRISNILIDDLLDKHHLSQLTTETEKYITILPRSRPSPGFRYCDDVSMKAKLKISQVKLSLVDQLITYRQDMNYYFRLFGSVPDPAVEIHENVILNDVRCVVLRHSVRCDASKHGVLLYFHGGGYMSGDANYGYAMLAEISRISGRVCVAVNYRLAPEFPMPGAVEDSVNVYRWLVGARESKDEDCKEKMQNNNNVPDFLRESMSLMGGKFAAKDMVVCGDSAGGGLALLVLQQLRKLGIEQPLCGWVIAPWTNLSRELLENDFKYDSMLAYESLVMMKEFALGNRDLAGKKAEMMQDGKGSNVSPLFGDCTGLPPLYFSVGLTEMLLQDTLEMAAKAHKEGVLVKVDVHPFAHHCWPVFINFYPEAREAVVKFCTLVEGLKEKTIFSLQDID